MEQNNNKVSVLKPKTRAMVNTDLFNISIGLHVPLVMLKALNFVLELAQLLLIF